MRRHRKYRIFGVFHVADGQAGLVSSSPAGRMLVQGERPTAKDAKSGNYGGKSSVG